jgi:hypothetical protein
MESVYAAEKSLSLDSVIPRTLIRLLPNEWIIVNTVITCCIQYSHTNRPIKQNNYRGGGDEWVAAEALVVAAICHNPYNVEIANKVMILQSVALDRNDRVTSSFIIHAAFNARARASRKTQSKRARR